MEPILAARTNLPISVTVLGYIQRGGLPKSVAKRNQHYIILLLGFHSVGHEEGK